LPSGIALILDKAESLEDIQDQRQVFIDREPDMWEAINAIIKTYDQQMTGELKGLTLPDGFKDNLLIKFNDPSPIMSEAEKLGNFKLRQELGIDTMISLLMKDDPSLDEDQAEEKFKKIIEHRIQEKMIEAQVQAESGIQYDNNTDNPDNVDPTNKSMNPQGEMNADSEQDN